MRCITFNKFELKYFFLLNIMSNNMEGCDNCLAYGRVVEGKIVLPCQNCALENNWMWNGKRCYGVSVFVGNNEEATIEELVQNQYFEIREREGIKEIAKKNNISLDEYCKTMIPKESRVYYDELNEHITEILN